MICAPTPLLPMKARKEELQHFKHVLKELRVVCKCQDIGPLPFGLCPTVLWKERMSDGIAKAIEPANAIVESAWETNSRADELQFLQ